MSHLVTPFGTFNLIQYDTEQEFERAIVAHVNDIFGERRIYLDCKRRIGAKDGKQSVPDAYLIDVSSPSDPQLYVVENEISSHDLFKHIGVQLLQFSVSFAQAGRTIKEILFDEVCAEPRAKSRCEKYAQEGGFRNLDHFLESLVHDKEFRALVIIDEETDDLHAVTKNLGFPVEIIEFSTYVNEKGQRVHRFDPFLADVEALDVETSNDAPAQERRPRDPSDLDTVVVPSHEDGFKEVFLGENRWWSVRIHPAMLKQLKYVAVYPLRLPVLTKIVGNKLFPRAESRVFEERYWWTRNIPMDGLGSIHEVKNFKRAFELMLQKKATLSPASPDYYAPATCYALWLSDQKPWLDQTEVLAFKPSKPATRKALELARYFSEPRDLPYDAATEQPAIRDLKYFLPSSTKPLGFLPATPKQNPRTRAWTLRRRWSDNGKRKEIELYLGRPASEEGTYIEKPSLEQFVQHCWDQASLATDEDEWLQWFCKAQALRMAGAGATDYGTEDTNKEDILQQQPKSFDTSYVVSRDLVLGENGVAYEVVKHKPDTAPTFVDDALDDERVSLGELSKALSRQEKEEPQPEAKPEQTPEPVAVEAEEVKPKPRYAFRSEYGPRLVPKKLESAKVMCIECSKPSAVNRFNQQTEWMKLRCGHERFLCLKCNGECHCK